MIYTNKVLFIEIFKKIIIYNKAHIKYVIFVYENFVLEAIIMQRIFFYISYNYQFQGGFQGKWVKISELLMIYNTYLFEANCYLKTIIKKRSQKLILIDEIKIGNELFKNVEEKLERLGDQKEIHVQNFFKDINLIIIIKNRDLSTNINSDKSVLNFQNENLIRKSTYVYVFGGYQNIQNLIYKEKKLMIIEYNKLQIIQ
ncbi:unnamed protein product [Paramecium sonneborni]|uniref:Uncharacterized protein n=1 Tax=Paramecium sonneborni TaxID=65129 RepID=A0A8S1P4E1_9CILI|nr:unnamed protein product [Paramecium sonneborni]